MSERDSNIGQEGVESIRIRGKRIEDLPLGQGNEAKAQLPVSIEQDRLNHIEGINAKYPGLRIDYIDSRVRECKENIERIQGTITEQATMVSDYKGHINMGKHRDREIKKLEEQLHEGKIELTAFDKSKKALFRQFPPYQVPAMEQQIKQCGEAIERCNDVIKQEHDSIAEFMEARAQCVQRDTELEQWGAVAEGS